MVEWKKLGEITRRNKGIPITAGQMSELASKDGNVRVFAAGSTIADIDESRLPKNCAHKLPSIIVKSRGYIDFEFYEKPFTHKNEMWSYSFDNKQEGKFIYYFLTTQTDFFRNIAKANSVKLPQLCVADTDNFSIPIPSLEEQTRIVGILDTFTSAIDNLKEQIAQRRKQYEYYRDQLLDLEGKEGVEMKYLLDVLAQPVTDGPHETPSFYEDGIPFISADAIVDNKINFSRKRGYISEEYDLLCQKKYKPQLNDIYLVKSGSTTGKVAIVRTDERFNIWSPLAAIRVNQRNHPYFVYYMLQTKKVQDQVKLKSSQGSQPNLSMRVLEKFIIPVPPLSEQQRLVSILDTFEASIANLEAQLAQREKQYEYYRNKLLTFE